MNSTMPAFLGRVEPRRPKETRVNGAASTHLVAGRFLRYRRTGDAGLDRLAVLDLSAGNLAMTFAFQLSNAGHLAVASLFTHLQIVLSDASEVSEGRDFGVISPQTCRVYGQDAKHALILAGAGWGRLPLWLVERDLVEGRLCRLATSSLGRGAETVSEAYLAHRVDEPLGPAARSFAGALLEMGASDVAATKSDGSLPL